ncbi:MAG TPA: crossover junction endodeoxyribonuclease RuvC [Candidatus Paceibacterota bacterium]|nr:crossover junction endodeoxyribonuclease RuvC [Candidatus Paceibacterota bacterium]
MKVLAIDPGYDRLGVAVLTGTGSAPVLVHSSCILTERNTTLPDRLHAAGAEVAALLEAHAPDVLAIETLYFNANATTAIAVAEARGIAIYLARTAGCEVREFGPQEVKVAVTGYGKSDKRAVIDMVKRLCAGAPERGHDDEYDAIAVGITALAHHRA